MKLPLPKIELVYTLLNRMSKREKIIFYACIIIVSLLLLDRLIINPVFSKINMLDKEISNKETAIKKDLRVLAYKDRITAERKNLSTFLSSSASEDEEVTSLLKEVEEIANKSSVYLVDMKPATAKESKEAKRFTVNLSLEAQVEQIIDFMYNIENSNNLLVIEKFQLTPKAKESSIAKCSITISKIVLP